MLDFINNNPGLAAIIGVIIGWLLSSLTERKIYKRQREDALEKERRDRFKEKAELVTNETISLKDKRVEDFSVILTSYNVSLNKKGAVITNLPTGISNINKLKREILYLENIGNSDINELEIATSSPKSTAVINKEQIDYYEKNNLISYSAALDKKLRKGDVLILQIYYLEEDPIINIGSASLDIYYRDSLNNTCIQPLFPERNRIYEPEAISYSEWRKHVNINNNLKCWEDRLKK